jgi:hypothetical protein
LFSLYEQAPVPAVPQLEREFEAKGGLLDLHPTHQLVAQRVDPEIFSRFERELRKW